MKRFFLTLMVLFAGGCLSRATKDQCRKACFNQVSLQQQNRKQPDWEGRIKALKAKMNQAVARLQEEEARTIGNLKKADEALDSVKKKAAKQKEEAKGNREIVKLKAQYQSLLAKLKHRYTKQIDEVREAKLKWEVSTKKQVQKAIDACVRFCWNNKWTDKQAACVSRAGSAQAIKACF